MGTGEPALEDGAGGRERQIGKTRPNRQQDDEAKDRVFRPGRFPSALGQQWRVPCNGEESQPTETQYQNGYMDATLPPEGHSVSQNMGIKISNQKQYLEKEHASRPHRWSAAEPG